MASLVLIHATASPIALGNFSGSDDFSSVSTNWGPDVTVGAASFTVANGVLNFVTPSSSGNEGAARFWSANYGSFGADWSVRIDAFVAPFLMTASDDVSADMYIQNQGDVSQDFVRVSLRRDGLSSRSFYADVYSNGAELTSVFVPTASLSASLALSYLASTRTVSAGYDANGAIGGYQFTLLTVTDIDAPGSDWNMMPSDEFAVRILGQATFPIAIGQLTIDNFVAEPTAIEFIPEPNGAVLLGLGTNILFMSRRMGRRTMRPEPAA
jgi:hypothetical protein